jgi:hypothetical protein
VIQPFEQKQETIKKDSFGKVIKEVQPQMKGPEQPKMIHKDEGKRPGEHEDDRLIKH